MKFTPDNITMLEENQIFVFGSNTAGIHGAGAARFAYEKFGAVYGVGEGLTGQSYAFPTLDNYLKQRTSAQLRMSILELYVCAEDHPNLEFLLTKVGCGLGGYSEEYMKSLFALRCPVNIIKPLGW